jgi:hypothetical protein
MLFLHEVHQVRGRAEDEFEAAYRNAWMPALAAGDDARLLWFLRHAHGSGPAYHFVTITAVRDGAAWERLARRVHDGDLADWARRLDELRHDLMAKILVPVSWSPMHDLDFASVPTTPADHELSIYMEDTGWPEAAVEDYTAFWEKAYYEPMRQRAGSLLDIQAVFRVAHGTGRRKEAVLMQKVTDHDGLLRLLTTEVPEAYRQPGTFMYEALAYRDRWESKLLRTSAWSPLY